MNKILSVSNSPIILFTFNIDYNIILKFLHDYLTNDVEENIFWLGLYKLDNFYGDFSAIDFEFD